MVYKKNNFFNKIKEANAIVDAGKTKAKSTREKYKSISDMQAFIDKSIEKRTLLIDTLKNTCTDKPILQKGVVLYVKLLEVIELIEQDFSELNLNYKTIQGSVTSAKRMKIVSEFLAAIKNKKRLQ